MMRLPIPVLLIATRSYATTLQNNEIGFMFSIIACAILVAALLPPRFGRLRWAGGAPMSPLAKICLVLFPASCAALAFGVIPGLAILLGVAACVLGVIVGQIDGRRHRKATNREP